jgi:hypothetical protein
MTVQPGKTPRRRSAWANRNLLAGRPAEPAPVLVRFECPLCGGPHSRSQHRVKDKIAVAAAPKVEEKMVRGVGA